MSKRSVITIDLSQPNLEWLSETPEHLESSRGLSRYLIAEVDQSDQFAATEWFCDDCGALVDDVYDGCPVCV